MLTSFSVPMHQTTKLIQLSDVLSLFEPNVLKWVVVDFQGVGRAPNDVSMPEFEESVRKAEPPRCLSWTELNDFASFLDQTVECLIVALQDPGRIDWSRPLAEPYAGFDIVLEADDSTEWRIGVRDATLFRDPLPEWWALSSRIEE